MQMQITEQIRSLPISERIAIIEEISRGVRENLKEKGGNKKELSIEERKAVVDRLRGGAAVEGRTPPTDEEIKEDYANYLLEKYK
jgi:hypothetical protein